MSASDTRRPMREAKKRGIGVSVLHATPLGRPVYEKLGFTELCRLTVYLGEPGASSGTGGGSSPEESLADDISVPTGSTPEKG